MLRYLSCQYQVMRAQVYVAEWKLGDWKTTIWVGDETSLPAVAVTSEEQVAFGKSLGIWTARTITHHIEADDHCEELLEGRVLAVHAVRVPIADGRTAGRARLEERAAAELRDDSGATTRLVAFLIDVDLKPHEA